MSSTSQFPPNPNAFLTFLLIIKQPSGTDALGGELTPTYRGPCYLHENIPK